MKSNRHFRIALLGTFAAVALGIPMVSTAIDTDLYLAAQGGASRDDQPNVLIILDNSGSMATMIHSRKPYDHLIDYSAESGSPGFPSGRIYWSTNGTAPSSGSNRWFTVANNHCHSSLDALDEVGFFGGAKVVAYKTTTPGKGWTTLSSGNNRLTDCESDNGATDSDGYVKANSIAPAASYTSTASEQINWGLLTSAGYYATLYSSNYMNYIQNTDYANTTVFDPAVSRIDVAKQAVNSIIDGTTNVRLGLMVFNDNSNWDDTNMSLAHGGRIVMKIATMDAARRTTMKAVVNSLTPYTYTPLSEALWETRRYFGGLSVDFGDNDPSATPARDTTAETGGNYISPFAYQCQQAYVILVTDGDPTNDEAANQAGANARIRNLPGIGAITSDPLDELAAWMYNNDTYSGIAGTQRVVTYTIGFGGGISTAGLQLLQATAAAGHGQYYDASDADQLSAALRNVFFNILATTTSYVAPTLSLNTFNTLYNRDEVEFAQFKPSATTLWDGNVKKYSLCKDLSATPTCTFGEVVDKNGAPAVDPVTYRIKDTAFSYWSASADGNDIVKGGAGSLVPENTAGSPNDTGRVVYTYTGAYDGTDMRTPTGNPDLSNSVNSLNISTTDLTQAMLSATDAAEREQLIHWFRGDDAKDVYIVPNGDVQEDRWKFADPIHSRPVAVTYGGTSAAPVTKLFVGTNDGGLRMVNESNGIEEWAFYPQEVLGLAKQLWSNADGAHPWGLDGSITVHVRDRSVVAATTVDIPDGIIDPSLGDYVHLYVNMRRGGKNIYALDVTPSSILSNPSTTAGNVAPKLMWVIRGGITPGYGSLSNTWSRPVVARVYYNSSTTKTVLLFGGGYDIVNDAATPASPTAEGNAIYMVDPATGERLWWASAPNAGCIAPECPDLALTNMVYSIPSELGLMDANLDGRIDRIYVGDLGGQVWRIDLSPSLKKDTNGGSSGYVLADLGCPSGSQPACTGTSLQDRRKFYYPPEIAQVYDDTYETVSQAKHDLVAIASGDREDPIDLITYNLTPAQQAVHNRIYVLRDYNTGTLAAGSTMSYPATVKDSGLYDATSNALQNPTAADIAAIQSKNGWYIDLSSSSATWVGEKSLAQTTLYSGVLFVSTFTPPSSTTATVTCAANEGLAKVFALNLLNGTAAFDWNGDGTLTAADRSLTMGGGLLPETVIVIRPEGTSGLVGLNRVPDLSSSKTMAPAGWFGK
jgi:type IV pilus assembly protein PilY1